MQVILLAFIVYRGYLGRHSNFQVRSCTTNWSYTFIQARNVQKIHFMIYKNVVSLCHFGRIVSIFWTYCVCSVDFDARLRFLVHQLLFQLHGSLFHVFVCSRVKCKINDVHRTRIMSKWSDGEKKTIRSGILGHCWCYLRIMV